MREARFVDAQSETRRTRVMRGCKCPWMPPSLTLTDPDKRDVVACAVLARQEAQARARAGLGSGMDWRRGEEKAFSTLPENLSEIGIL